MAAVTHRVATPLTTNVASYVSGAFTPAAGDLLIVFGTVTGTVTNPAACTASANGITFTQVTTSLKNASGDRLYCFIANQLVGASPVSMTVTVNTGADAGTGCVVFVASVSGMSKAGATAVRQSNVQANGVSGTPTVTLGGVTLTTNPVLAFCANGANPAALTPPANFTEQNDTGYATPTTGAEYASRNSGHTSATVTFGSATTTYGTVVVELDASAAALSATAGQATEIDAAQPVTKSKRKEIGQPSATATAQSVAARKARAAAQAAETDTAQPVGKSKRRAVGQASAIAAAQVVALPPILAAAAQAAEADTAQPVTARKTRAIGQASTTHSAQPVTARKTRAIGQAIVLATAGAIAHSKSRAVTAASDTATAQPVTPSKTRAVGQAAETAVARLLTAVKRVLLGRADSAGTAQPVTSLGVTVVEIGTAVSTSSAGALGRLKQLTAGQASGAATAQGLERLKALGIGQPLETDTAQPVLRQPVILTAASPPREVTISGSDRPPHAITGRASSGHFITGSSRSLTNIRRGVAE